jgi:glucose uptake protein
MYLPGSYAVALLMMLGAMIFWGSWPNTYKLARNRRVELFYVDYALGIFLSSILIGLTLGTLFGPNTFVAQMFAADRSTWLYAALAGALWNCGNVLLTFGVALVGMAVAFPLSIGLALVVGVIGSYLVMPRGNTTLLCLGVAMVFAAIIVNSLAYRSATKAKSGHKASAAGILVCLLAGILFSGFGPLVGKALSSPRPLGPYGVTFFFTLGALISTLPLMTYFMRHPIEGAPLSWKDYRDGTGREHTAGLIGGFIWTLGTTFAFVPASMVGIALAYAIGQANPLVAALWGVFVWREFRTAPRRADILLGFMFVLYFGGLLLLASSFHAQ